MWTSFIREIHDQDTIPYRKITSHNKKNLLYWGKSILTQKEIKNAQKTLPPRMRQEKEYMVNLCQNISKIEDVGAISRVSQSLSGENFLRESI